MTSSPSTLPKSSKHLFDVNTVEARSWRALMRWKNRIAPSWPICAGPGLQTSAIRGPLPAFDPWIGGNTFTLADIVASNTIPLATMMLKKLCDIDLMAELPEAQDWLNLVNEQDSAKQIAADRG